jgi:hypothetical protein
MDRQQDNQMSFRRNIYVKKGKKWIGSKTFRRVMRRYSGEQGREMDRQQDTQLGDGEIFR